MSSCLDRQQMPAAAAIAPQLSLVEEPQVGGDGPRSSGCSPPPAATGRAGSRRRRAAAPSRPPRRGWGSDRPAPPAPPGPGAGAAADRPPRRQGGVEAEHQVGGGPRRRSAGPSPPARRAPRSAAERHHAAAPDPPARSHESAFATRRGNRERQAMCQPSASRGPAGRGCLEACRRPRIDGQLRLSHRFRTVVTASSVPGAQPSSCQGSRHSRCSAWVRPAASASTSAAVRRPSGPCS
jgi:hypothetical protein